jgi:hypothetical protein
MGSKVRKFLGLVVLLATFGFVSFAGVPTAHAATYTNFWIQSGTGHYNISIGDYGSSKHLVCDKHDLNGNLVGWGGQCNLWYRNDMAISNVVGGSIWEPGSDAEIYFCEYVSWANRLRWGGQWHDPYGWEYYWNATLQAYNGHSYTDQVNVIKYSYDQCIFMELN